MPAAAAPLPKGISIDESKSRLVARASPGQAASQRETQPVDNLWTAREYRNKVKLMRANQAEEATVAKSISVDAESPDDSATMFRLRIDDLIVGQGLTAAQAHLLVGEILERVVLPRRKSEDHPVDRIAAGILVPDHADP